MAYLILESKEVAVIKNCASCILSCGLQYSDDERFCCVHNEFMKNNDCCADWWGGW